MLVWCWSKIRILSHTEHYEIKTNLRTREGAEHAMSFHNELWQGNKITCLILLYLGGLKRRPCVTLLNENYIILSCFHTKRLAYILLHTNSNISSSTFTTFYLSYHSTPLHLPTEKLPALSCVTTVKQPPRYLSVRSQLPGTQIELLRTALICLKQGRRDGLWSLLLSLLTTSCQPFHPPLLSFASPFSPGALWMPTIS